MSAAVIRAARERLNRPRQSWSEYRFRNGMLIQAVATSAFFLNQPELAGVVEFLTNMHGDMTGIRLRDDVAQKIGPLIQELLEPMLVDAAGRRASLTIVPASQATDDGEPDRVIDLQKYGLHVPEGERADRCQNLLGELGDISVKIDEDDNLLAFAVPHSIDLAPIFAALDVDAMTIEPTSQHQRRKMLTQLKKDLNPPEKASAS